MENVLWLQAQWSNHPGKGERITLLVYPWAQGTSHPSQQPSLPVFKLCAFDRILGLKIFYAKSSWPLRSRMGELTPWLLGPGPLLAQHLQFRLGEQAGVVDVPSLWGYATLRLPQIPTPGCRGRRTPPLLSASGLGALSQGSVYTFHKPHSPHVACMLNYSQSVAFLPCSLCPASPCWDGGGVTDWGLPGL